MSLLRKQKQLNACSSPKTCVYSHLILYDSSCGLCQKSIQFILRHDHLHSFVFAPLNGSTAIKWTKNLPIKTNIDSLVLIENYESPNPKIHLFAKGALRICYLLGGFWKVIGSLFWLPQGSINWIYHFIAKHRHRFFKPSVDICQLQEKQDKNRFLD